jgi:hypothetical protein
MLAFKILSIPMSIESHHTFQDNTIYKIRIYNIQDSRLYSEQSAERRAEAVPHLYSRRIAPDYKG